MTQLAACDWFSCWLSARSSLTSDLSSGTEVLLERFMNCQSYTVKNVDLNLLNECHIILYLVITHLFMFDFDILISLCFSSMAEKLLLVLAYKVEYL